MIARITIAIFFILTTTVYASPVPDTGQTKCYNDTSEIPCPQHGEDFYGQDGSYFLSSPGIELHWYESHGIGRKDIKIKDYTAIPSSIFPLFKSTTR